MSKKPSNPLFSCRVPKDLKDRIDKHCKDNRISQSEVLIPLLEAYLDNPDNFSVIATVNTANTIDSSLLADYATKTDLETLKREIEDLKTLIDKESKQKSRPVNNLSTSNGQDLPKTPPKPTNQGISDDWLDFTELRSALGYTSKSKESERLRNKKHRQDPIAAFRKVGIEFNPETNKFRIFDRSLLPSMS
jgi:hypothetical protein